MIIRKLENFHKAKIKVQMKAKVFAGVCALSLTAACGTSTAPLPEVAGFSKGSDIQASLKTKITAGLAAGDRLTAAETFAGDVIWTPSAGQISETLQTGEDGYVTDESLVARPEKTEAYQGSIGSADLTGDSNDQVPDKLSAYNALVASDAAAATAMNAADSAFLREGTGTVTPQSRDITDISPSLTMLDTYGYFGDSKATSYTKPTVTLAVKKRGLTNGNSRSIELTTHATINGAGDTSLNFYVPLDAVTATNDQDALSTETDKNGVRGSDTGLVVYRTAGYGIYGVYSWDEAGITTGHYKNKLLAFSLTSSGTVYTKDFHDAVKAAETNGQVQYRGRFLAFGKQDRTPQNTTDADVYDASSSRGWIDMKVNFDNEVFVADVTYQVNESGNQAFAQLTSGYSYDNINNRVYAKDQTTGNDPVTNVNTIAFKGKVSGKDDSTYFVNFGGSLDSAKHTGTDTGSIAGTFNGPLAEDVTGVFRYSGDLGDGRNRFYEGAFGAARD